MRCPRVQVSAGVRFGPRQVNDRPGADFAASVSSGGSVTVTVDCTDPPGPRIARRRLAVERQVQDFPDRLAGVLGGREPLPLARTQEQRLPVRSESDDRAELSALPPAGSCHISLKPVPGPVPS